MWLSIACIALLVTLCSVALQESRGVDASTQGIISTPEPVPNGDLAPTPTGPGYAVGVPAVKHTGGGTAPTPAEVRAFVLSHKFALDKTATGKPSAITDVEFITASAASAKLHGESIGLPDTTMVIYVKVHGPFVFTAMSLPPGLNAVPPHVQDAVEVFDAATGNLLLAGTA